MNFSLRSFNPKVKTKPKLAELIAGGELAAMNIPQVLGYARIAGMPVVSGLYTLLFPLIAFAALGSSKYLVVAADSATAAILAAGLEPLAEPGSAHYVALAVGTALLTGVFLALARLLRLAFLADFLSQTVLVGFLAGVGVQLAVSSIGTMLGLETNSPKALSQVAEIARQGVAFHSPTLILSCFLVVCILLLNRFLPRIPAPMIAVIGSTGASWFFTFSSYGIKLLGPVAGGLPHFEIPKLTLHEMEILVPIAGSCAVMILAQSAATARFFAFRNHDELEENSDLIGLSIANLSASLTGTFVVNGSPSQTAMVESCHGKSPWSHFVTALIVALVLLLATRPLQYLPLTSLASIIFLLGVKLIDWRTLSKMRSESPGEFVLAVFAILTVVFVGVEEGILVASVFSILRIVSHSYRPHTGVLGPTPQGGWEIRPTFSGSEVRPGMVVYRFGAALFYANAGRFAKEIHTILANASNSVRWVVVDAEAISQLDYSASRVLVNLINDLNSQAVVLAFGRVTPDLKSDMDRHHVTAALGSDRYFAHLKNAVTAFENSEVH